MGRGGKGVVSTEVPEIEDKGSDEGGFRRSLIVVDTHDYISVGRQVVDVPSFLVRVESQRHIDFSLDSPFGGGRPGRLKRKKLASKGGGDDDGEDDLQ